MLPQRRGMLRVFANGEDGASDLRMHGLDASVEHFGKAGDFADILHGDAGIAQKTRRSAGRDQFGAELRQASGEIGHTCLIGNADEYSHVLLTA